MDASQFELAFYGEILPGVSAALAKQNLAAMFKASEEQMEKMFSGKRVVIRNKLDLDTALKYVAAMEKRGAKCKVEVMGKPGVEYVVETEAAPDPEPSQPNETAPKPSAVVSEPSRPIQATPTQTGTGLPVAGERVEEILGTTQLDVEPVGARLSDEKPPIPELELGELAEIEILPAGSDLKDAEPEVPAVVPDTSHLRLDDAK